jgi:CxxC motif-containing protein
MRTVTAVVRVENRTDTMVSVKTEAPIPKDKIFDVMEIINKTKVIAPVKIGDVILSDIFGTKIIATKSVEQ